MSKPIAYATMLGIIAAVSTAILSGISPAATAAEDAPTAIKLEYLMSAQLPLDSTRIISPNLVITDVPAGGWVEGPKIKGKILTPAGDWLRITPSGAYRLDVRFTVQTDDEQLIYMSYNGILQCNKEQLDRIMKGGTMQVNDCYFITAPTFETKSEKYGWLNDLQAVGKAVSFKVAPGGHVRYDIFTVK